MWFNIKRILQELTYLARVVEKASLCGAFFYGLGKATPGQLRRPPDQRRVSC